MGSVFLTDVDDYLGPSQACVNPLFTSTDAMPTTTKNADAAVKGEEEDAASNHGNPRTNRRNVRRRPRRRIIRQPLNLEEETTADGSTPNTTVVDKMEKALQAKAEKATVSVADCLSCSGCVTSAEAVLVEQHSLPTLLQSIMAQDNALLDADNNVTKHDTKKKKLVCTLSPASVADLYRHLQLGRRRNESTAATVADMSTFYRQVASALGQSLHATLVLDASVPLQLSWIESAHEFCHRYEQYHRTKNTQPHQSQQPQQQHMEESMLLTPSIALSATRTRYLHKSNNSEVGESSSLLDAVEETHVAGRADHHHQDVASLPLLASSCPGFVCFVEKTAPSIVPHLATAKSPMAMAGALVKHILSSSTDASSASYHVAVMPCHDKKLEAGRRDLAWDRTQQTTPTVTTTAASTTVAAIPSSGRTILPQPPVMEEPPEPDVDLVLATSELYTLLLQEATTHHHNHPNNKGDVDRMTDTTMEDAVVPSSLDTSSSSSEERDWIIAYLESMPLAPCTGNLVDAAHVLTSTNHASHSSETATTQTTPPLVLLNSHLMESVHPTTNTTMIPMDTNESLGMSSSSTTVKEKGDDTSDVMNVNGSGSYADFLFRYAAQTLFQHSLDHLSVLPWKRVLAQRRPLSASASAMAPTHRSSRRSVRSSANKDGTTRQQTDHAELTLYHDVDHDTYSLSITNHDSTKNVRPVLKFATAYGFKNVQLILQKLTKEKTQTSVHSSSSLDANNKEEYHYIEVMACPSGCLNGGGQMLTPTKEGARETPAQVRARVTETQTILTNFIGHNSRSLLVAAANDNHEKHESFHPLYGTGALVSIPKPFDAKAQELLHTRFHVVPKLELTTGATAGVALSDTKW